MKNLIFFLSLLTFSLSACGGECPMKAQLAEAQTQLEQAKIDLDRCQTREQNILMHTVYLKTRADLTLEETQDLTSKLNSMAGIEGVLNFGVGQPAATGDPRLQTDYNYVLQMGFASEEDLAAYQKNEDHLAARESTKGYLAGPPVVFDYWIKQNKKED